MRKFIFAIIQPLKKTAFKVTPQKFLLLQYALSDSEIRFET